MEIPDRLLNQAMVKLSPSEFKLFIWLCKATQKTKSRWITVDEFVFGIIRRSDDTRISPGCGLSHSGVGKALKKLEQLEFIFVDRNTADRARICRIFSVPSCEFIFDDYARDFNNVVDYLASELDSSQFVVFCWIYRCTIGMKETCRVITFDEFTYGIKHVDGNRLNKGLNMAKTTIIRALKALEEFELILIKPIDSKKIYQINFEKLACLRTINDAEKI